MNILNLNGVDLAVTDDHALPAIRKVLPDYSENIGRLAAAVERKYQGRGFVDVGANVGDTAAIVRAHSNLPILCIEGSQVYFDLLKENVRQLRDVELECVMVDSASGDRLGRLSARHGTASFRMESDDDIVTRFERLENILARHPRFQTAKTLKLDTDGMDARIILGALDWIATVRPVLFWEHDIWRDDAAGGPALSIFRRLFEIGYREAVIFDNEGDYIQTLALDASQQLADLSDYLPGGAQGVYGYYDIAAFHAGDLDLSARVRQIELDGRRVRRRENPWPMNEPLLRAILEGQFATHRAEMTGTFENAIANAMQSLKTTFGIESEEHRADEIAELRHRVATLSQAIEDKTAELRALANETDEIAAARERECARLRQELEFGQLEWARKEAGLLEALANRTVELQALRAQMEAERYRLQVQVNDQEKRVAARDAEIDKLRALLREVIPSQPRSNSNTSELQKECARLRYELDNSIALRVARSLHRVLGPIRKLVSGSGPPPGDQP